MLPSPPPRSNKTFWYLCLNLLSEDILQRNSISSKLADSLPQLLNSHLVLVEVEAEIRLVVDVAELLDIEGAGGRGVKLLWDWVGRGHQFFQKIRGDSQVVTASQLGDLTNAPERGTHDDGLVAEFLVVIEDALDGGNSWVFLLGVGLTGLSLVPIEDTANEGGDEKGTGLSGGDGLNFGEQESQVAVNLVVALEDAGSLDSLPCGCDFNQDAGLIDADGLVEINDVESLVDGALSIERPSGVNFS